MKNMESKEQINSKTEDDLLKKVDDDEVIHFNNIQECISFIYFISVILIMKLFLAL